MFGLDYRMRYRKPLSRSFADLLCRKKGIKYPVPYFIGNPFSGIADLDYGVILFLPCAYPDLSLAAVRTVVVHHIPYGMGRIDDHVQYHLIELSGQTGNFGKIDIKIRFDIRHIFPFVPRYGNGALYGFVDVYKGFFVHSGMGELLHRLDDLDNPFYPLKRLIDRFRDFFGEEFEVRFLKGLFYAGNRFWKSRLASHLAQEVLILFKERMDIFKRISEKIGVIADILHRGIDLVGNTRSQLADRLELL